MMKTYVSVNLLLFNVMTLQVERARTEKWFPTCERPSANKKKKIITLDVLILGVLRVLGRGIVFDELFEQTLISGETHRCFFHLFIGAYSQRVYPEVVQVPQPGDHERIQQITAPYAMAGFPGCIGSIDGTHFYWETTPVSLKHVCKGKESYTSVAIECAVTHWREIIHMTTLFNGAVTDMVMSSYLICV